MELFLTRKNFIMLFMQRSRHTSARAVERITIPVNVKKRRDRKLKNEKQSFIQTKAIDSPLIISCKRKQLYHYRDNRYVSQANEEIPLKFLASGGWLHYKSKGDYFTINTQAKQDHLDKQTKFSDLGLSQPLIDTLTSDGIKHPSHIQVETIPEVLNMSNVICAAETGCGKTLSYLLPIIEKVLLYKPTVDMSIQDMTSPLAVVLLPSHELSLQVTKVAERYSEAVGLNVLNLSQGSTTNRLIRSLRDKRRDVDILVTTPGSLAIGLRAKAISPLLVSHVVIDEADTLMDDSFNKDTVHLLNQLASKPAGILGLQIVLVSATLPRELNRTLGDTINAAGFIRCTTHQLHHMLPHITHKFVRLGPADKPEELVKVLKAEKMPTMVFAKSCATASYINKMLIEKEIPNIVLHGEIVGKERTGRFQQYQEGECDLLVCSDVASRGLDTSRVSHVINYDFPKKIADYIHRVGRVGRLGSYKSGKVTNFIGHRPEISLVWQIERAVRSNTDIASSQSAGQAKSANFRKSGAFS